MTNPLFLPAPVREARNAAYAAWMAWQAADATLFWMTHPCVGCGRFNHEVDGISQIGNEAWCVDCE